MTIALEVVVATSNAGKLRELGGLLPGHWILHPQSEFGIASIEETGLTFVENAILKARHASQVSGLPAIADDSGLSVLALDGAPGIRSARYAGDDADDAANNAKLIAALAGEEERDASFHCALVFLVSAADPAPDVETAAWHGTIIDQPRGSNGFGYDPHFEVSGLAQTAAELPAEVKNRISHRGQAARAMAQRNRAMNTPFDDDHSF